jgi:RNA methyltransferase, TrmH family
VNLDFSRVDISSPSNRWIKLARSLHRRRQRYRERAILVEGVRPIREAMNAALDFTVVLLASDVDPGQEQSILASKLYDEGARVFRVERDVLDRAADTESPQGILAVMPVPDLEIRVPEREQPLFLIADRIRDPGNLGTLLRSAQGAGAHAVFIGPECADPFAPKVIRAGMGSHFRVPIQFLDWKSPPALLQDCRIVAADMGAEIAYDRVDWQLATAIIIGNETSGLSADASDAATKTVGIPLANDLESLNAGVAGSVILFEAARQRRKG